MNQQYTLYGTSFSLYTGKLRAYLQKKGVPFTEVMATLSVYRKFIKPRTGVSYIPVLQTPEDQVLQDTTAIIDKLETVFPERSIYPSTPRQKLVSLLLEVYGDEWLVIPAMHYRWNFQDVNQPFIYQQFGMSIAPGLPAAIRGFLGRKIGEKFKGFVPALGITEQNIAAIESSYTGLLAELEAHFSQHDYVLGNRPSIADLGLIGPLYAHLYHDPYPGQLMRDTAPAVAGWVERMIDGEQASGEFLPDDEIPVTLMPILQRMAREQLPVIQDTDRLLAKWRKQHPDQHIPRFIGKHTFTLEGVAERRAVFPYVLWMFKRPVDFYHSLNAADRQVADTLLLDCGFADTLAKGLRNRMMRLNNRLAFV